MLHETREASCLLVWAMTMMLAAPAARSADESSLAGHWEGAYVRMGSVQTVSLDLVERDGRLAGTYDIPELAILREPIRELSGTPPEITLRLTYGAFSMHVSADTAEMTGVNAKWNPPVTLHLKRRERIPGIRYPREDLSFGNGEVTLAGTLVKPLTPGPHPAIVIVHGSGDQGRRDGFYAGWGEFFARQGLATLIYDKRGVGESTGSHLAATFDDLAGDIVAAVEMLQRRPDIQPGRTGLFGISQGGWLAPLAASRARAVSFLILDVGPAVTVREQELDRVEYSLRADEFSEEDIREALDYITAVFDAAYSGRGKADLFARAERIKKRPWAEYIDVAESDEDLEGWRLIRYDPAPVLRKTAVPLLALFGEADVLVPPEENAERMRALLTEAGNPDFAIRVIPGAGHDMETFATLKGGEWAWPEKYWVWPRKAPGFYQAIRDWLAEHRIGAGAPAAGDAEPAGGNFTGEMKPVLYVGDVEKSVPFYRDALGFEFDGFAGGEAGPYYAEMLAAKVKFGLHEPTSAGQEDKVGRQRLYFRVRDLAAQRSRVLARGAEAGEIRKADWMDMFIVRDPDGNEIVFAVTDPGTHPTNPWSAGKPAPE